MGDLGLGRDGFHSFFEAQVLDSGQRLAKQEPVKREENDGQEKEHAGDDRSGEVQIPQHNLGKSQSLHGSADVQREKESRADEHSQKVTIVVHADIVTDPDAVVVELIAAPIALSAVFRVLDHVRPADIAVIKRLAEDEGLGCFELRFEIDCSSLGKLLIGLFSL